MSSYDVPERIVHLTRLLEAEAIDAGYQTCRIVYESDDYTVEQFGNTRIFALDHDNKSHLWAERGEE